MFAEERVGHAKTSVHTQKVTMYWQPAIVCIRRCSAPGLSKILNIDLYDFQWTQASLPVQMGGLGVRSASMLASSAFLALVAAT